MTGCLLFIRFAGDDNRDIARLVEETHLYLQIFSTQVGRIYRANQKEPFLYSSRTSKKLYWTVRVPETTAGLTLSSLLLGSTPVPFFLSHKRTKATFSHESVAPPLTWNPLNPYGTFLRPLSQLLSDASSSPHILFTCSLHATHRPIASMKRKTSHPFHCHVTPGAVHINKWVSLLCICLYIPHDGFRKKKPCIFCDRAVRHHQAIKNNTSHAYLHSTINNISKYCLYGLITQSACGTETGSSETC